MGPAGCDSARTSRARTSRARTSRARTSRARTSRGGRIGEGQTERGGLLACEDQATPLGFGQSPSETQPDSVAGRGRVSTGEECLRFGEKDAVVLDRDLEPVTKLLNHDPDRAG